MSSSPLGEARDVSGHLWASFNRARGFEQLFDLDHELMLAALFAKLRKFGDYRLLPFSVLRHYGSAMYEVLIARFLYQIQEH